MLTLPTNRSSVRRSGRRGTGVGERGAVGGLGCSGRNGLEEVAFTYVELLVAAAIFLFVAIGLVSSNIFGLRITEIVTRRSDADAEARRVIGRLSLDIQRAQAVEVGNGGWGGFTPVASGSAYVGNDVRLSMEDGSTIHYYLVSGNNQLQRSVDLQWPPEVMLESVANGVDNPVFIAVASTNLVDTNWVNWAENANAALTNDISRVLVQVQLQLSKVGRRTNMIVGPGTAFTGNEIRFAVMQRGQEPWE